MGIRWLLFVTCLPGATLVSEVAQAQGIGVSPLRVDLGSRATSSFVNVANEANQTVSIQVKVFAWSETVDGTMELADTSELTAFPSLFTVEPGGKRKVRIGTTASPGEREKTYRVFFEQLPSASPSQRQVVQVLSRISIPAFVAPTRAVKAGAIEAAAAENGQVQLELVNQGTVHLRADKLVATTLSAAGTPLASEQASGWYVLSGARRRFVVKLPGQRCDEARALRLEVETTPAVALSTRLELPDGGCAR